MFMLKKNPACSSTDAFQSIIEMGVQNYHLVSMNKLWKKAGVPDYVI